MSSTSLWLKALKKNNNNEKFNICIKRITLFKGEIEGKESRQHEQEHKTEGSFRNIFGSSLPAEY